MRYREKKGKKIKKTILFMLLLFFSITLLARYVVEKNSINLNKTKEIYFYSDKLEEVKTEKSSDIKVSYFYEWNGIDDLNISFAINNKKNELLSTSYDINYEILYQISDGAICDIGGSPERVLLKEKEADIVNLTIKPNRKFDNDEEIKLYIWVKTTDGFVKILAGTFEIKIKNNTFYEMYYNIIDEYDSPYATIDVFNRNEDKKEVVVDIDTSLYIIDTSTIQKEYIKKFEIDNTNSLINKIIFDLDSLKNISFKVYKKERFMDFNETEEKIEVKIK